jgi:hypothetical protein
MLAYAQRDEISIAIAKGLVLHHVTRTPIAPRYLAGVEQSDQTFALGVTK